MIRHLKSLGFSILSPLAILITLSISAPCKIKYFDYSRNMDIKERALGILSALGQETRLDVFRLLVRAGDEGMTPGTISETLKVRANTLSTHLGLLSRYGLVKAERDGRSIYYRAHLETMQLLVTYLVEDCCGGNPELCEPIAKLAAGRATDTK